MRRATHFGIAEMGRSYFCYAFFAYLVGNRYNNAILSHSKQYFLEKLLGSFRSKCFFEHVG